MDSNFRISIKVKLVENLIFNDVSKYMFMTFIRTLAGRHCVVIS